MRQRSILSLFFTVCAAATTVALALTAPAAEFSSAPELPWTAQGCVTTPDGTPLADVEIWAHAGIGSLMRTGLAKTGADGRYTLSFGRGVLMRVASANLQVVNITAHRGGYAEANLNRHGARAGALKAVADNDLTAAGYKIAAAQLFLPGTPQTIDFVMAPAARVIGQLAAAGAYRIVAAAPSQAKAAGQPPAPAAAACQPLPLPSCRLWLTGPELPPGSSVLASAETDAEGNFTFENVPVGFAWQLQVEARAAAGVRQEPKSALFKVEKPGPLSLSAELYDEAGSPQVRATVAPPTPAAP